MTTKDALAAIMQALQNQNEAIQSLLKAKNPNSSTVNYNFEKFAPKEEEFSTYLERFQNYLEMRSIVPNPTGRG